MLQLPDFRKISGAVTDFGAYVYTLQEIQTSSYIVKYRAKGEDKASDRAREYTINLDLTPKAYNIGELVKKLATNTKRPPTDILSEREQALNII